MITKVEAWKTSDGEFFETLDSAKIHEIEQIVDKANPAQMSDIPALIMAAKDQIFDIWTTGPRRDGGRDVNESTYQELCDVINEARTRALKRDLSTPISLTVTLSLTEEESTRLDKLTGWDGGWPKELNEGIRNAQLVLELMDEIAKGCSSRDPKGVE